MCGIVGYIGSNALKRAVEGLKCLEYRGYDSSGACHILNNKLACTKRTGRISNLENIIKYDESNIAIAHTRWATHGIVSENNAHPHISNNIAIVHNGIIDNFFELKEHLLEQGRTFVGETDTEVIAHLIDIAGGDLYTKVNTAISKLNGSYAIAVISADEPDKIVVARKSSPLILGNFSGGAIVASDIQALLPHTNKIIVMEDGETAIITKDAIQVYKDNIAIKKDFLEAPWSFSSANKGEFDTFMEKEILEQPAAIIDTMLKNDWVKISDALISLIDEEATPEIMFTACGTSYHACKIGSMLMEGLTGLKSQSVRASEIKYSGKTINANTIVIAVSQSGETADTLAAIKYAKDLGAKVISVINVLGSSLSRESDLTIYTAAGPEISVASTKAFTSQLTVLVSLVGIINNMFNGGSVFDSIQKQIYDVAKSIPKIFKQKDYIKLISKSLIHKKSALFLGRGLSVPVAQEGALKLKEISYIHAEGMSSAELKHGPIALIEDEYPVIVIAVKDNTYDKVVSNIHEVKARGGRVIAIANEDDTLIDNIANDVIRIPSVNHLLYPMLTVIPLQLLALYTAWFKGMDVDKPRNLAKAVSVE